MNRKLALAALALTFTACSDPPSRGMVIDKEYQPSWIQVIPGSMSCNSKGICSSTPSQMIPRSESWKLEIRNGTESGWRSVDRTIFDKCNTNETYPECEQS